MKVNSFCRFWRGCGYKRVIKDVDLLLDVNKILEEYKNQYDNDDINGCEACMLLLATDYNRRISENEEQQHAFKHLLFESNCIKNPMGVKYAEKDYKNTMEVFSFILKVLNAINDPNINTSNQFVPSLSIDASIISDIFDIIVYTEVLYSMNITNSERMDLNSFSQKSFVTQLLTSVLFYQDQNRLLEKECNSNQNKYLTGMELSIANKPVSYINGIKVSAADSMESSLEAIDEIIRFLFYKFRKKMVSNINISELTNYEIKPYNNADYELYAYIANQRHMLQQLEEGIRCGFISFECITKDKAGQDVYVFMPEDIKKSHARFCSIHRREKQFRTHVLFDGEAQKEFISASEVIRKLAEELIDIQISNFVSFDLTNYHIDIEEYQKAQRVVDAKINIVHDITKEYYLKKSVSGVKISDLLTCYRFLNTLGEIIKCASLQHIFEGNEDNYLKELCIVEIQYLCNELSKVEEFDLGYASLLIDRFVFHDSANKDDDVFAQPLIKISNNQVVLCPALVDQVNLDRFIERQFIRFDVNIAEIGIDFEKYIKESLAAGYSKSFLDFNRYPIPNLSVNTNPIKYKAFDGKDIEFDVVMVLGDYLILTELKAIMTSYDLTDLIERKRNINKAIEQLKRRKESVINDWDTFRSCCSINLPEKPFNSDRIILVACSDAYDFTPLQVGEVFITDGSTYLKYFTNPYIDQIEKDCVSASLKHNRSLWNKAYPTAEEFMHYLRQPVTTNYIDKLIKINYIPIPCFDDQDMRIAIAECQLMQDPTINMFKQPTTSKKKVSKNTRCPCGSGKKFKKCCKGKGIYD